MPEDRTLGETNRRIDALTGETREGFRAINERLDKMPTGELLGEILKRYDQRMDHLEAEVVDLERRFDGLVDRLDATRKWLVGIAISAAALLIAFAGFLRSVLS